MALQYEKTIAALFSIVVMFGTNHVQYEETNFSLTRGSRQQSRDLATAWVSVSSLCGS